MLILDMLYENSEQSADDINWIPILFPQLIATQCVMCICTPSACLQSHI